MAPQVARLFELVHVDQLIPGYDRDGADLLASGQAPPTAIERPIN